MGSILPENNNYRVSALEAGNSGAIGLSKNNSFKPRGANQQQPVKSQEVSAGNNIAKGHGSFKTVN